MAFRGLGRGPVARPYRPALSPGPVARPCRPGPSSRVVWTLRFTDPARLRRPLCEDRRYVFLILVAVLAMALDLAVLVMYARGRALLSAKYFTATYLPMAEMLLSFLLAVVWLAASVSFAAQVPQANAFPGTRRTCASSAPNPNGGKRSLNAAMPSSCRPGFSRQLSTTAVVLGFFSCIVWAVSSVLAFNRFRDAPTYVADEVLVDSDASTAGPSDTEASSAASTTTRASYGAV